MNKNKIRLFIIFILCVSFVSAEDNLNVNGIDEDFPIVSIMSGYGDWHYEQVKPEPWLLSNGIYPREYDKKQVDLEAIIYSDSNKKLVYPYVLSANHGKRVISAEKIDICGVSTIVVTLQIVFNPKEGNDLESTIYNYERVFLNLSQEGQVLQLDDDYSSDKMKGNVPLQEFLDVYKYTCVDGFIDFPDISFAKNGEWIYRE